MANLMAEMHTTANQRVFRPQGHCFVQDICSIFEMNDKDGLLGQGVSGKVYKTCLKQGIICPNPNVAPNTYYALKCMNKSVSWIEKSFLRESHNMMALANIPGTINIIGTFEDSKYFCILSELAGSDAFTMVKQSVFGRLDENYVKHCIYQILKSVFYLHSMDYVHRDIKPENIVLTTNVFEERQCQMTCPDECNGTQIKTNIQYTQPKLIDLADCGSIDNKAVYNKLVGTMCYLAPERLRAHYGYELKKADVWAVGVSCYEMLSGKRCFFGVNNDQLFERIKKGCWVWPQGLSLSDEAKDFVKTLLDPDVNRRPCAAQALTLPWLQDILKYEMQATHSMESREKHYSTNPLIKKVVEVVDCDTHPKPFVLPQPQQQQQQQQANHFSMALPNLYVPQQQNSSCCHSNHSSTSNCFVGSSNQNGGENQISPSASMLSGPSCSPVFTAETAETPSASVQNSGAFSNFNNFMQQNQIPKFVPSHQPSSPQSPHMSMMSSSPQNHYKNDLNMNVNVNVNVNMNMNQNHRYQQWNAMNVMNANVDNTPALRAFV